MINEDILNDLDDLDSEKDSNNKIDELEDEEQSEFPQGNINQLLSDPTFTEHMAMITTLVDSQIEKGNSNHKNDPKIIQKSNQYASAISKEINAIFRTTKAIYYKKFPEL